MAKFFIGWLFWLFREYHIHMNTILSGKKRPVILFMTIHPLNWPFAFLSRLLGNRVLYWRRSKIPASLVSKFEVLDPADYFDYDTWQGMSKRFNVDWIRFAKFYNANSEMTWKIKRLSIDLS